MRSGAIIKAQNEQRLFRRMEVFMKGYRQVISEFRDFAKKHPFDEFIFDKLGYELGAQLEYGLINKTVYDAALNWLEHHYPPRLTIECNKEV